MDGSSESLRTEIVKNSPELIDTLIIITIDEAKALAGVLNNQYLTYDDRGLIVSKLLKRINNVLDERKENERTGQN